MINNIAIPTRKIKPLPTFPSGYKPSNNQSMGKETTKRPINHAKAEECVPLC